MIRQDYKEMLNAKSVIREMFTYATEKGKEIGYENVFDYSLGNPSVPTPKEFTDTMIRLLQESDPVKLHGYSPSPGIPSVRAKIAESLNKRFGTESYLSFLGLGVNAPMPSLGSLAADALNGISSYAYRLVIPAIVISLIVLSLNLFGDGLRDAFDPKLNA